MASIHSPLLISLWNIADNRDPYILIHVKPTYATDKVRSHYHEYPTELLLQAQKGTPRLVARVNDNIYSC